MPAVDPPAIGRVTMALCIVPVVVAVGMRSFQGSDPKERRQHINLFRGHSPQSTSAAACIPRGGRAAPVGGLGSATVECYRLTADRAQSLPSTFCTRQNCHLEIVEAHWHTHVFVTISFTNLFDGFCQRMTDVRRGLVPAARSFFRL